MTNSDRDQKSSQSLRARLSSVKASRWFIRLRQFFRRVRFWDVVFYFVVIAVLVTRAPMWLHSWRQEGTQAAESALKTLAGESFEFPPKGQKSVVVFWATWCGPCRVELDRLKAAAEDKSINPLQVLAISVGEDAELVQKTASERGYPFRILLDPQGTLANRFQVSVTPTVVFVDQKGSIVWQTAGLSPTLVVRAKRHLAE